MTYRADRHLIYARTHSGFCVFDTIRSERGGPPVHVYDAQDEWLCVTEGQFDVQVDSERHHLGPGDSILGPRGVPHAFANTSETGRLLIAFQPAGSMKAFFRVEALTDPCHHLSLPRFRGCTA